MSGAVRRFQIFVRFNTNNNVPVLVDSEWDVRRLKQEIGSSQGVDPSEIRIIFAGHELDDDLTINDCEIPQQSVIHAVRVRAVSVNGRRPAVPPSVGRPSLDQQVRAESGSASGQRQAQYYIYCKECKKVGPGKLRVCCSQCKEGAIVLSQDPASWEDVLCPGRITGTCQTQGCNGRTVEFYFKCSRHDGLQQERCAPLQLVRSNTRDVPCLACEDVQDPVLVFPCEDGHAVCLECFQVYCTTKLNDRQFVQHRSFGYTLPCPGISDSCGGAVIPEAHHFHILDEDQYERFKRFGTEEYVLQEGGVLCPGRNCGMGLLPAQNARNVQCTSCELTFCRHCLEPFNRGHSCRQSDPSPGAAAASNYRVQPDRASRARWENEANNLMKRTTKRCPGCKSPIEKSGGCNHMTCTRCKFEFCWICLVSWNRNCQGSHWFLDR